MIKFQVFISNTQYIREHSLTILRSLLIQRGMRNVQPWERYHLLKLIYRNLLIYKISYITIKYLYFIIN